MNEQLKKILENAKNQMEQAMSLEIEKAKSIADSQLISAKNSEIEKMKQESLANAQEEYANKVNAITTSYEAQKEKYRNDVYSSIEAKISSEYSQHITNLSKQLEE